MKDFFNDSEITNIEPVVENDPVPEPKKEPRREKDTREGNNPDLSNVIYGKLPPQAIDLEDAVLGALLIDRDAVTACIEVLRPETFYLEQNRIVYEAIERLFRKNQAIDLLTVTQELKVMDKLEQVGGAYYVTQLTNRVMNAAHVEHHARIIIQKHLSRELIRVGVEMVNDAYEDTTDVFDLASDAERKLMEATGRLHSKKHEKVGETAERVIKVIEKTRQTEDGITGVPSGFEHIDRLLGGWHEPDFIILAARPSMGKSALAMDYAKAAAIDFGRPTAFFSLEMSREQLVKRLISGATEIDHDKVVRGQLTDDEMRLVIKYSGRIENAPLFIDDTPAINIFELRAKVRRLKAEHNIELVILDYLQLMGVRSSNKQYNREGEISEISRGIKAICKELNIPIIALSQLSRKVEDRGGLRRPMLSDLRESGAIEQDADVVHFLYRPEYYGIESDESGNSTQGVAEIIFAKNRNGACDTIMLHFIGRHTKFVSTNELSRLNFAVKKQNFKRRNDFTMPPEKEEPELPLEQDTAAPF